MRFWFKVLQINEGVLYLNVCMVYDCILLCCVAMATSLSQPYLVQQAVVMSPEQTTVPVEGGVLKVVPVNHGTHKAS